MGEKTTRLARRAHTQRPLEDAVASRETAPRNTMVGRVRAASGEDAAQCSHSHRHGRRGCHLSISLVVPQFVAPALALAPPT